MNQHEQSIFCGSISIIFNIWITTPMIKEVESVFGTAYNLVSNVDWNLIRITHNSLQYEMQYETNL